MLLKNLKIISMMRKDFENGDIFIKNGKFKIISSGISNREQQKVYDFSGCTAIPGMIDAHSHCGLMEMDCGPEGDDSNDAFGYNNAHLRAIDGFSYYDSALSDAINVGVTSICITPGSINIINGQMAVVKTSGTIVDQRIINPFCGIKAALGENTKNPKVINRPQSRMGIAACMREAFQDTINYIHEKKRKKNFKTDLKFEALQFVIEKKIPLRVHAHRTDDICTAIRIADEFDISIILEHGTSAHLIANYIAEKGIPVVVGPILSSRRKSEVVDLHFSTCGILEKSGVKIAITTDHPVIPIQSLLYNAILAYKAGMSYFGTLKAITINPAEICDCSDRIGSIEKGKDADLVIFDGDPLDMNSNIVAVIQDGEFKYKKS
ncbi:amidohydrolase family protein [bacterium]|nr:amidohydrolase family protein [bacterium]